MAKKAATIEQPTAPGQVSALDRVISETALLHEAALEVLIRAAKGVPLEPAHFQVVHAIGIDNKFALERRVSEVRNLLGWQAAAGTREERETITTELAKAVEKRNAEVPDLQRRLDEIVREIQSSVDALNEPVETLETKLNAMNHALSLLRNPEKLPEHIRNRFYAMRDQVLSGFRPLLDAQASEEHLTKRLELLERAAGYAGRYNVGFPNEIRDFISRENIWEPGHHPTPCARRCAELKEKLQTELKAAQEVISRDLDAYNDAMADANKDLDFWIL
ncbi:MAG: hypothetical protein ACK526_14000 [Planctomyces sp.]